MKVSEQRSSTASGSSTATPCPCCGGMDAFSLCLLWLPLVALRVTHLQLWDLGGQSRYRSEWGRYTKGSDVIIFVVDTQAPEDLPTAKKELHQLLEDRELARLPLLILANKIDLGPKISEPEMIKGLNLDYITETNWLIIPGQAGSVRR